MARLVLSQFSTNMNSQGYASNRPIQANNGHLYYFFVQAAAGGTNASDIVMAKSINGGINWTLTTINTGLNTAVAVWYDRDSGLSSDYIHLACIDTTSDDVLYYNVNTASSDAVLGPATVLAGSTAVVAVGSLSIVRARGGNVYVAYMIDNPAVEYGFARMLSADVGAPVTFTARDDVYSVIGADPADNIILMPSWAADANDIMAFFWDSSADTIFRLVYDDSATPGTQWASTSIATGQIDTTTTPKQWGATVDLTNSQNLLCAWGNLPDQTTGMTLSVWKVTESAIAETANKVFAGSVDDQGACSICIVGTTWYVFYGGSVLGDEVAMNQVSINCKSTTDGGATAWGSEVNLMPTNLLIAVAAIVAPQRLTFTDEVPGLLWVSSVSSTVSATHFGIEQPEVSASAAVARMIGC